MAEEAHPRRFAKHMDTGGADFGAKRLVIVRPVCACQEVLWFANRNFKKVIHIESGLKRAGFGAKRLVMVQLVCACQGRVALSSLDLHLDSARRAWGLGF
jgi:hypothetical protein